MAEPGIFGIHGRVALIPPVVLMASQGVRIQILDNGASQAYIYNLHSLADTQNRNSPAQGNIKSMMINAICRANTAIYEAAREQPELRGMGTTAVVMLADQGRLHVAHVGDSRAYLKNGNGLTQITMDHSYVQDLVNFGQITKEQARTHPRRNIITRVLGVHDAVSADYSVWDFHAGDWALACTDGLTGYMEDGLLEQYMNEYSHSGEALVEKLIQYAVDSGGADNITVAVVNNI